MVENKQLSIYIGRMIELVNKIQKYTKNTKSFDDFEKDEQLVDSCLTPVTQLGEIAWQIVRIYGYIWNIPYKELINMRNFLVHNYHKIDTRSLRNTIQNDIPELKKILLEYK